MVLAVHSCHPVPEEVPIDRPPLVEKTNQTKVYMHYMPWFVSREGRGYWGSHWKMNTKDPDKILPNGQREIAAHYYPLIGPYDSADPIVVDYHVLLMKYAGIDGVLIDWYGSHDVLDYKENLNGSNALIQGIKEVNLNFGIVYEEFTTMEVERRLKINDVDAAKMDITYIENEYFTSENYIKKDGENLLLTFGPRHFLKREEWTDILADISTQVCFMPLWNHKHRVGGENASGEYAWVDFNASLSELKKFYSSNAKSNIIGSAYPGFHDYYAQGGWGESYGFLDHKGGATLASTLALAKSEALPIVQLVTWNDFGEGTMIEPTVEFEFSALEQIQKFTGVSYTVDELHLVHDYYLKRKNNKGNLAAQQKLEEVFEALSNLKVELAQQLLSEI